MTRAALETIQIACIATPIIAVLLILGINWHSGVKFKHETCYQRLGYNIALDKSYVIEDYCGGKNN